MERPDIINTSDRKHFRSLYELHFSGLKYFAMQYLHDEEMCCDLLQEIFIRLWEKGEEFDSREMLKVYLYKMVRNSCLTFLRDNKRREKRLESYEPEEVEESFVNRIIEAEVYAIINEIFEELPASEKRVYLKSLEGKSHKEISAELNIAINTIKKHKNNANHYLRRRLKDFQSFLFFII